MKKILFLLIFLISTGSISFSQDREIVRGAMPGELYLTSSWYGIYDLNWGPPFYDTLRTAIYRITENGKKLTLQYDADYFADYYTDPGSVMQPYYILADVTPGVVYCYRNYNKNSYEHSQLWVSFDYGKNWIFREEDMGRKAYVAANIEKLTYRGGGDGLFKSKDFGFTYENIPIPTTIYGVIGRTGLDSCDFWNILGSSTYSYQLVHTVNCRETHTFLPIDSQYMFGQIWGIFPDVYRGGKAGEVYISSMFTDGRYKVSFSADTGHTFRHVYVSEVLEAGEDAFPVFMSDREPGVFYIVKGYEVEDFNPWGWHTKICVEYYRDYGETLVATYCHDLHKNYGKTCEPVNDLVLEKINEQSILLTWTEPESSLPVIEYRIYRNEEFLTSITTTSFLDDNLEVGEYAYYVVAHYEMGCVADSSNHVKVDIEVGIDEYLQPNFTIIPNPATNQVTISSATPFHSVEIFNFLGQTVVSQSVEGKNDVIPSVAQRNEESQTLNISHLNNGIYFVRVGFESGGSVRKLVKM